MSQIALSPNPAGTGTFTIASPNSNTDRTLTLPDNTGTVLTSASSLAAANLTGRVPAANVNLGGVVQVVQTVKTDTFSAISTSFTDITGLSVSITPSNVNSRILVMYSVMTGETNGQFTPIRLVRDSTPIGIATGVGNRIAATTSSWATGGVNTNTIQTATFLDSPATTSATTYKLQIIGTGAQTMFVNRNQRDDNASYEPRTISSITVMEIAA